MYKTPIFSHNIIGSGRPQILLIGNGLERCGTPTTPDPKGRTNQLSWDELVDSIKAENCIEVSAEEKKNVPFPLLYSLLSSPFPAPSTLSIEEISEEDKRLRGAMGKLSQASYPCLDLLKTICADHIMTTNYNYSLEQSFFPGKDFMNSHVRSKQRFNLNPISRNGNAVREVIYRMHSGYLAENSDGTSVGLWHIHGECSIPKGVVLGHDRYGRLLSHIEKICSSQDYENLPSGSSPHSFKSWPELFLYGDVHILGFSFDLSEFDLWWLLKRKQREQRGNGKVYFYEFHEPKSIKQKLLKAHGVELPYISARRGDYLGFYTKAITEIINSIKATKGEVSENDIE